MAKSALSTTMDELVSAVAPTLRQAGFRKYGRTFNRTTHDGLVHVIGFQMGPFEPPGTTPIPGLTQDLYGWFTVNLGAYIPEVAMFHGSAAKSVVREYHCQIRRRVGPTEEGKEHWWRVSSNRKTTDEILAGLRYDALPFLARFEDRDQVLAELRGLTDNTNFVTTPRIVSALILWRRGQHEEARELLSAQARDHTRNPRHPEYVRALAERLGISIVS